ncbi:MAG: hypothetical protein R3F37_09770 [Candidatus Competibacteraceae bacterium]
MKCWRSAVLSSRISARAKESDPPTGEETQALPLEKRKSEGQTQQVLAADGVHKWPVHRFTEATLLTAMETAGRALEDKGLSAAMKETGVGYRPPARGDEPVETAVPGTRGRTTVATDKGLRLMPVDPSKAVHDRSVGRRNGCAAFNAAKQNTPISWHPRLCTGCGQPCQLKILHLGRCPRLRMPPQFYQAGPAAVEDPKTPSDCATCCQRRFAGAFRPYRNRPEQSSRQGCAVGDAHRSRQIAVCYRCRD